MSQVFKITFQEICGSPKLDKKVCKHGSTCHVKSFCGRNGNCTCSMRLTCVTPKPKARSLKHSSAVMDTQAVVRTGLSEAEEKDEILKLLKEIKLVSSQVTINADYSRSSLSQSSS